MNCLQRAKRLPQKRPVITEALGLPSPKYSERKRMPALRMKNRQKAAAKK
jgi:hypothetical protein